MAKTGFINFDAKTTVWWEPSKPNVIKVCIDDARFVNDEGGKPGLWISIKRSGRPE
jgi:hypothetical protein